MIEPRHALTAFRRAKLLVSLDRLPVRSRGPARRGVPAILM